MGRRKRRHDRKRNRGVGNTLAEFALIGALVALVAIAGLMLLGTDFNRRLAGLRNDMGDTIAASKTASSPMGALLEAPSGGFTLPSGMTAQQFLEAPLTDKIQTVGANGTTSVLAQQFDALIQQLIAEGKIDPAQANHLQALANKGHEFAHLETLIEQAAVSSNGDAAAFNGALIAYNGQSYTPHALSELVASNYLPTDGTAGMLNTMATQYPGPLLAEFLDLYNTAQGDAIMQDPTVSYTVSSLTSEIAYIAELVEHSSAAENFPTGSFNPANLTEVMASVATHYDSSVICTTGGYTDQGVICNIN